MGRKRSIQPVARRELDLDYLETAKKRQRLRWKNMNQPRARWPGDRHPDSIVARRKPEMSKKERAVTSGGPQNKSFESLERPVSDRWMLGLAVVLLVFAFLACGLMAYSTGVFS